MALRDQPPEHMDHWNRNEGRYQQLRNQGLYVVPVFADEERGGIEYLMVSVMPPRQVSTPDP
jgi:hypothetical protein